MRYPQREKFQSMYRLKLREIAILRERPVCLGSHPNITCYAHSPGICREKIGQLRYEIALNITDSSMPNEWNKVANKGWLNRDERVPSSNEVPLSITRSSLLPLS
ncbi:hypothetical protein CIPAW_13G088100 [Carya illinoinensis]|uniref:Uncharacterized protein n=1 Tax=Carya illinoinensis TaxID=32201 RepID=A0A8T1NLZ6_CARIL|nr:hypothetical protein CIPAW_13G088100 [Carya illinoinensis]